MADPAQLRKCQEILGKLPEKQHRWNPMWEFLKGLEGFDTARACECLVKLIDNHYDTIAVLKLAEKRDLVEDAGILPGDALRIVIAAREYVPRPEPPTPQHHHATTKPVQGVEHRQDAYRPPAMRDATAILTSPTASESTFQAIPQQQPGASDSTLRAFPQQQKPYGDDYSGVGSSRNPASQQVTPPQSIKYPHTCRLCNAECISEVQYLSHYSGQKHSAALRESKQPSEAAEKAKAAAQPHSEHSPSTSVAAPSHACGVCNVQCGSETVLRSHFNGKKHAKKMELATDNKDNRPTAYLYCSICDVTSMCKRNLVMHLNGKKHAQNMKEDSEDSDEDSSYYSEYSD